MQSAHCNLLTFSRPECHFSILFTDFYTCDLYVKLRLQCESTRALAPLAKCQSWSLTHLLLRRAMELGILLTANLSMLGCCASVTYQTSSVLKSSTGCVEIEIHDLPGHVPCVRHGPSENLKSLLLCLGTSQATQGLQLFDIQLSSARNKSYKVKQTQYSVQYYEQNSGITGVVVDLPNCLNCLWTRFFMIQISACSCMLTRCCALTQLLHHIKNLATNMPQTHAMCKVTKSFTSLQWCFSFCLFQSSVQSWRNY